MIIHIKDGSGRVVVTMRDFFGVTMTEELNGVGSMVLSAPSNDLIRSQVIRRGYRVEVYYFVDIHTTPLLFSGFINEYRIMGDRVEIQAYNWISYLQHRIMRQAKTYTNVPINTIISDIYSLSHAAHALPFTLGKNDIDTSITLQVDQGSTVYDVLQSIHEAHTDMQYRISGDDKGLFLDVSDAVGSQLDGLWIYDERATNTANIKSWRWVESLSEYWNFMLSKKGSQTGTSIDQDDVNEVGLLFERFENDNNFNPRTNTAESIVPEIQVTQEQDWWNTQVGDRRLVRITTSYKQVAIDYIALIQSKTITYTNAGMKVSVQVAKKYTKKVNIMDEILGNLRKDVDSLKKS